MSNVVEPETFVRRFRDPVSTGTSEDGALKLLSRFPRVVRWLVSVAVSGTI